jgi:hypothetical protein
MNARAMELVEYVEKKLEPHWPTFVRVTFGAFVGSLVILLILLYADVPIVGSL